MKKLFICSRHDTFKIFKLTTLINKLELKYILISFRKWQQNIRNMHNKVHMKVQKRTYIMQIKIHWDNKINFEKKKSVRYWQKKNKKYINIRNFSRFIGCETEIEHLILFELKKCWFALKAFLGIYRNFFAAYFFNLLNKIVAVWERNVRNSFTKHFVL